MHRKITWVLFVTNVILYIIALVVLILGLPKQPWLLIYGLSVFACNICMLAVRGKKDGREKESGTPKLNKKESEGGEDDEQST